MREQHDRARFESLRTATRWLSLGLTSRDVKIVFLWTAPVLAAMAMSKVTKLLVWRPALPSGATLGDGIQHAPERVRLLLADSSLLRIAGAIGLLFLIWRVCFRRYSAWWVPVVAGAGYLASRVVAVARGGEFSLTGSWTLQRAIPEADLLYALFRQDLIVAISIVAAGLVLRRALRDRRFSRARPYWPTLVIIPLLALLGLELAHFLKTGLMGTGRILAFLTQNWSGTWFLIRSELDWKVVTSILAPLGCLLATAPAIAAHHRSSPTAHLSENVPANLLPLAACAISLIAVQPIRLDPVYARFAGNPLYQIVDDFAIRGLAGASSAAIERAAASNPVLFDPRYQVSAASIPNRNVVIVLLESVRASATQLHRPELRNTPFLVDLAARGAIVDSMYAVEPRTSAAWIAVLDGIYPGDGDIFFLWGAKEASRRTAIGLPRLLASQHYTTAFFVATRLNLQNDQQLIDNFGFDTVVHFDANQDGLPDAQSPLDPTRFERVNTFGLEDRALLEPIEGWLDRANSKRQPFFLTVMTNVGHYPYTPPKDWPRTSPEGNVSPEYADYLSSIAYIDDFVRRLYQLLVDRGIDRNTVFLVLGDHGESFGEHGPRQHFGQAYEEVLHVPAVLVAPGLVAPGSRVGGLRQQVDVLPTILDLLGLKLVSGTPAGRSLLLPEDATRRLYFSGVYEDSTLAMRQGTIKYLYNFRRTPTEVYDLSVDPDERHDIGTTIPPDEVSKVETELLVWRASVNRALLPPVTAQ